MQEAYPNRVKLIGSSILLSISAVLWSFFFLTTTSDDLLAVEHRGLPFSYWEKSFPAEKIDRGFASDALQVSAFSAIRGTSAPIYNSLLQNPLEIQHFFATLPATKLSIYQRANTTAIRLDQMLLDFAIWLVVIKIVQTTSNKILNRSANATG